MITKENGDQRDAARTEASWHELPKQRIRLEIDRDPDGEIDGDYSSRLWVRDSVEFMEFYGFQFDNSNVAEVAAAETKWGIQSAYLLRKVVEAKENGEEINVDALKAHLARIQEETK